MLRNRGTRVLALVTSAVLVTGCDGPSGTESVSVTMQQSDATFSASLAGWSASVRGDQASAVVSKDTVLSLTVEVTEIQFLPRQAEAQAGDDGVWISLSLAQPVPLDLMTLPTEGESPLVIASGEVPVGSYGDVRLFVENAQIVFKGDINLGVAFGFKGGVAYPVTIPSGPRTGIKTDAEFSVTADAEGNVNDVHLLFSPTATFLNVSGTGTGEVILAPVIRSRPEGS